MTDEPIFLVGAPRSGTTLLAAMLAAHSRLSCGPETHFFRRLAQTDAAALTAAGSWPVLAVDFICSITHTSYNDTARIPLLEKYQLRRDQVESFLRLRPPSLAAILAAVTEQAMAAQGKQRWAEKTPDHLEHAATIRRVFPASPIVRIVRDPRDAALSLTKVPWGAHSYIEGLLSWRRMEDASASFFATDGLTHTLRYEDLVSEPQATVAALCAFLGEEYEAGMLDTSATGRAINARNVPWKDKVSQPVDASRAEAWRSSLTPQENLLAEALLGDRMAEYGYTRLADFNRWGQITPLAALDGKYAPGLIAAAQQGVRYWRANPAEAARARLYLGDPSNWEWLTGGRFSRFGSALKMLAGDVRFTLQGGRLFWLLDPQAPAWTGGFPALLKVFLARNAITLQS
ncbi:MAG: sulfotransferase [Chloroflexi bacterium]|nr:sulfotransferase [Chloroflexota bacterium]